jgi:fructoselysine-6-P-deglycase FrlB-like protein
MDRSWCHTVGYVAPLLAATAVAGHLAGHAIDATDVAALLGAGLRPEAIAAAEAIAAGLADARSIVTVGSGADRPAARELALKLEEGTWLPSTARDLETVLHGHLSAMDASTGLVLLLADPRALADRAERARGVLRACSVLGVRIAAILSAAAAEAVEVDLTPLGRIVVPASPGLAAPAGALLGTAVPLQVLTERLARARGTNPDPIRRDDPRYLAAAAAVAEPAVRPDR